MLTQLLIFRELSILFYGNELFLGTFLSSWLFWVGSGSLLARRLLKKDRPSAAYFPYVFLAISLLFPATILLIRASKSAFPAGEFIGPLGAILYTFSAMSVLCVVIGGQFSIACAVISDKGKPGSALARVYLFETLGAVLGGVLFTYILIGSVPTFVLALALSLGCIFVSLGLLIGKISLRRILLVIAALAMVFVVFRIEPAINRIEWKRYQFVRQEEARNATISLVKMGSIKNVFIDGKISASFPDPEGYEPAAHWPLLASGDPARILIIGETSLGLIKEALKHGPKHIDYVIPDNSFVELVSPFLGNEDILALKDPALHIHYLDARAFVRNNKNKYDVAIINIPDVPNLKTNRFYTEEFYNRLKDILKAEAILGLSIVSSENYLSRRTRRFNASVYDTLKAVFKNVEVIPGDTLVLLVSPSAIDMHKETFLGRLNERAISNLYVIPSHIEYKLENKRRAEFKKLLGSTPGVDINRDFKPTTCYYFTDFWLNKFASPLGYLSAAVFFIFVGLSVFKKRRGFLSLFQRKEVILVFVIGFVGILLEMMFLLCYQIISGDVYWQMGILFASFMAGLFLGSLLAGRVKDNSRQGHSISLMGLSVIIVAVSVCAAYLLPHLIYLSTLWNILIFIALLAITGSIVGAAFVTASFIIQADDVMLKAGRLYAADLWGAALGAILSTNLIAPLFGVLGALKFSAVIGSAGLAMFLMFPEKSSQ